MLDFKPSRVIHWYSHMVTCSAGKKHSRDLLGEVFCRCTYNSSQICIPLEQEVPAEQKRCHQQWRRDGGFFYYIPPRGLYDRRCRCAGLGYVQFVHIPSQLIRRKIANIAGYRISSGLFTYKYIFEYNFFVSLVDGALFQYEIGMSIQRSQKERSNANLLKVQGNQFPGNLTNGYRGRFTLPADRSNCNSHWVTFNEGDLCFLLYTVSMISEYPFISSYSHGEFQTAITSLIQHYCSIQISQTIVFDIRV